MSRNSVQSFFSCSGHSMHKASSLNILFGRTNWTCCCLFAFNALAGEITVVWRPYKLCLPFLAINSAWTLVWTTVSYIPFSPGSLKCSDKGHPYFHLHNKVKVICCIFPFKRGNKNRCLWCFDFKLLKNFTNLTNFADSLHCRHSDRSTKIWLNVWNYSLIRSWLCPCTMGTSH